MLKTGIVWQEETFEIKKVGVITVVFTFLAFLWFFLLSENLVLLFFLIN